MKSVKKHVKKTTFLLTLALFSCESSLNTGAEEVLSRYQDHTVTVYNGNSSLKEIESYQAQVKTYYSNSRRGIEMEPGEEYRLSLKMMDGTLYSRMDFDSKAFPDLIPRSLITSDKGSVLFQTLTNTVEMRLPPEPEKRLFLNQDSLSVLGRVNMDEIIKESQRLSLDILDETPGLLALELPPGYFQPQSNGLGFETEVISCRLSFDTKENLLLSSEMVVKESDGSEISSALHPLYQESDGIMVKVGQVQVVDNRIPFNTLGSESSVMTYETPDDIPEISEEELKALQESGVLSQNEAPVLFGYQFTPDFQEVFVDLYEEVKINSLEDSLFKLAMEG